MRQFRSFLLSQHILEFRGYARGLQLTTSPFLRWLDPSRIASCILQSPSFSAKSRSDRRPDLQPDLSWRDFLKFYRHETTENRSASSQRSKLSLLPTRIDHQTTSCRNSYSPRAYKVVGSTRRFDNGRLNNNNCSLSSSAAAAGAKTRRALTTGSGGDFTCYAGGDCYGAHTFRCTTWRQRSIEMGTALLC